jgi:hypothetical protein
MALYYLANPEAASKMKTKLMELYEQAKDGSFEAKDALIAELHRSIELLPETSAVEFKPLRTQNFDLETPPSLIERLTQGMAFFAATLKPASRDNTVTHLKTPKPPKKKNTPPKRYFTQH